jgi:hypothetical protein
MLRKSSGFGVFAKIFSKNIVIPSIEIPLFGEAPKRFWAIIAKFGFLRMMTRRNEFGYSGDPNNRIIRLFGSPEKPNLAIRFFSVSFAPIFIRKIGERRSKPNSVNPRPCQSVC